jgi:hypothetical protein
VLVVSALKDIAGDAEEMEILEFADATQEPDVGVVMPEHGFLARFVKLLGGANTEAPDATVLMSGLVLLSAMIGWRARVEWGENPEPLSLYLVVHATSGGRKTASTRSAGNIFREGAGERVFVHDVNHISDRGLLELVDIGEEPEDVVERMGWLAAQEMPPGHALVFDEFGQTLIGQGNDWRAALMSKLLEVYNGYHSGIQTGGKKIKPGRCSVSLLATITTEELRRAVNAGHARGGLLGRLLFVPQSARKPPLAIPPKKGKAYLDLRKEVVDWIAKLATWHGCIGNVYDCMTRDATALYVAWYEHLYDETAGDPLMEPLFKRNAVTVVKLATLLAISDTKDPSTLDSLAVHTEHVENAIALVEGSISAAVRLLETETEAQSDVWLDRLHDWMREEAPDGEWVRTSDAFRAVTVPREAGDRTMTREEKVGRVSRDGRFEAKPNSGKGGGHVIRLKG